MSHNDTYLPGYSDENQFQFKATDTKNFILDADAISVQIMDTKNHFCWRLWVNGKVSAPYFNYRGILIWQGYAVVTSYFGPDFKEFVPFKVQYTEEV